MGKKIELNKSNDIDKNPKSNEKKAISKPNDIYPDDKRFRLNRINIKGYKSIMMDEPMTLNDVNILLGANGSGKSNLISFFKMLGFMMTGSLQAYVEAAGTAEVFLYYGSKKTKSIQADIRFQNARDVEEYLFVLSHASPDRLIITSEEVKWGKIGRGHLVTLQLETNFKEAVIISSEDKTAKTIKEILHRCKVYQFHDTSSESYLRKPSHIDNADYLQSEGGNLAAFLYALKKECGDYYARIVSYIKMIMPQFDDFYLEPNKNGFVMLKWRDNSPNDYIQLPQQISDGTLRFIALSTLLLQPPQKLPSVIIIDEPELGLHPSAIIQLAEMIKLASGFAQIIVATQSPLLVDCFTCDDIIVVDRDVKNVKSVFSRLHREELEEWLESYTISELWDKNVIGGRP